MRRALVVVILLAAACTSAPQSSRPPTATPKSPLVDVQPPEAPTRTATPGFNPEEASPPGTPPPRWQQKLDRMVADLPISVAVSHEGAPVYGKGGLNKRVPASVQKLALTMALFETLGPRARLETTLVVRRRVGETIPGDVWILGSGDPTLTATPAYASRFGFRATSLKTLASKLDRAGVSEIQGSVIGSTTPFARDWHAPGWKSYYTSSQVGFPSALTVDGNVHEGRFTPHPERLAAERLTKYLERRGIAVAGRARAGVPPRRLTVLAQLRSRPLKVLARYMNHVSSNFFAEVLGKRLGLETYGAPGTIAKAARAISAYARARKVFMQSRDCSGLSYENKVAARAFVRLLTQAETEPWWPQLRRGLPKGGVGTLEDRLFDVRVRAKTGTLVGASALAGWVWLERADDWAAFAIMSRGLDKARAIELENRIVSIVARRGIA